MRPFTLQQRFRALQPVSAARSLFLAYIFKMIPMFSPNPFGAVLPPLPRPFVALQGTLIATPPVVRFRPRDSPSVSKLSLPFGIFQSLWIVALRLIPAGETCPSRLPDLPSLPVFARLINNPGYDGSTFQIRYFPPGSLSFEPLGTIHIMHRIGTGVNLIMKVSSEYYLLLNHRNTEKKRWMTCV